MDKTPSHDCEVLEQSRALLSSLGAPEPTSPTPDTGLPADLSTWEVDSASALDSVLQELVVPECEWPADPVERSCRYRNGRCSQPRTRKRSGDLHSFCDHHRQKSILNQRKFDQKRRLAKLARLGKGLDCVSPRVRGGGSERSSTALFLPDDGGDLILIDESPGSKRRRVMCTVDEECDGECTCGNKCKDVRYDINFITDTSVAI